MSLKKVYSELLPLQLLSLAVAFSSTGCNHLHPSSQATALVLSSQLSLKSYVHSAIGANDHKSLSVYFPLLEIYDPYGKLVYVGHNAKDNSRILKLLPENMSEFVPLPNTLPLQEVMEQFPDFQIKSAALLETRNPTIITVFLEDCHACSVQEEALDSTQQQLHDRGVNLLIVKVAKPALGR
jgi:hypothetical protein